MTATNPIVLQLVRANPFEALILNELERRPAARQEEWLRCLLVQGFQCECRALHVIESRGNRTLAADVAIDAQAPRRELAAVNDAPMSPSPPAPPSAEAPDVAEATTTEPAAFAALQKVIG
jgi:hypothetical protein